MQTILKTNTIKDNMQRKCKIKWTLNIATHFVNTDKLNEMYNSKGKINNWKPNQEYIKGKNIILSLSNANQDYL